MPFRVSRVLLVWVWQVQDLRKWGVCLSRSAAKAKALNAIHARRPELASAPVRSSEMPDWAPAEPKAARRSRTIASYGQRR